MAKTMKTNFVQQMQDIAIKAQNEYLSKIEEPITFPEGEMPCATVIDYGTYEEDCVMFNVLVKEIHNDSIISSDGKEYRFYEIDDISIANLADAISEFKDKKL